MQDHLLFLEINSSVMWKTSFSEEYLLCDARTCISSGTLIVCVHGLLLGTPRACGWYWMPFESSWPLVDDPGHKKYKISSLGSLSSFNIHLVLYP